MAKYWCELCKTFVLDSKAGRAQHESSPRHKINVERQISNIQRNKREKERQLQAEQKVLKKMGINVKNESVKTDHRPARTTSGRKSTSAQDDDARTDESGNELVFHETVPDSGLVAKAPGEWTVMEGKSDKKRTIDDDVDDKVEDDEDDEVEHENENENDNEGDTTMRTNGSEGPERDTKELKTKVYQPPLDLAQLDVKKEENEPPKKKPMFKKRKVNT